MRLDHIAYRTKNRHATYNFFREAMGYELGTEFQIEFDDGSKADCLALTPPESRPSRTDNWVRTINLLSDGIAGFKETVTYHSPPVIFVSDGPIGSIVGDWVQQRDGVGGIHHIAYQVVDVKRAMKRWESAGYAEWLSEEPMECPGLTQVFSKPSLLTGVIYELISREGDGFCEANVKSLMESTKGV